MMIGGRQVTAIGAIAIVTVLISGLVSFLGLENEAAIRAGFIPSRISGLIDFTGVTAVPGFLTPLSSALLHIGFFHLFMNMLLLVFTGREAERIVGVRGMVLLYLIGAYAAAGAQWLVDPSSIAPMVGASGATSAVVGAYSLFFGRSRARAIGPIPAQAVHVLWLGIAWTGINLLSSLAFSGAGVAIAAAAHIGGFAAGLALAKPLLLMRWRKA